MSPSFHALTARQQVHRLRGLARAALARYRIDARHVKLLYHLENTTFRVDGADGRHVLRINRPRRHDLPTIRSELTWLEALRRDTDLVLPRPVRNRSRELVTSARTDDVPEPRDCVLFEWVPGRFRRRMAGAPTVEQVGALAATLHLHAERWTPPPGFVRPDVGWGTQRSPGEMAREFDRSLMTSRGVPASLRRTFAAARERIEPAMRSLGRRRDKHGLIHSDLHFANCLFEGGEIRAIDFDDCGFGHYVNDAGITLWYLRRRSNFEELRRAYLRGYRSVRRLSEREAELIDTFNAARTLFMCAWFASRTDHPELRDVAPRFMKGAAADLKRYLAGKPQVGPWIR